MSSFTVDLQSLEELNSLLLMCAGELSSAEHAVGPGKLTSVIGPTGNSQLIDSVNGGGTTMLQLLGDYQGAIGSAGKNVQAIVTVLEAAIKHYQHTEAAITRAEESQK